MGLGKFVNFHGFNEGLILGPQARRRGGRTNKRATNSGGSIHDFKSFKHGNRMRKMLSLGFSNSYSDQTIKSVFISLVKRMYNE